MLLLITFIHTYNLLKVSFTPGYKETEVDIRTNIQLKNINVYICTTEDFDDFNDFEDLSTLEIVNELTNLIANRQNHAIYKMPILPKETEYIIYFKYKNEVYVSKTFYYNEKRSNYVFVGEVSFKATISTWIVFGLSAAFLIICLSLFFYLYFYY